MSCKAMGIHGELLFYGFMAGVAVYSCGPNVVVGAVGTAGTGILAAKDKVNQVILEARLDASFNPTERRDLADRVKAVDENKNKNLDRCSRFAWSMIPFVGPYIALTKSV